MKNNFGERVMLLCNEKDMSAAELERKINVGNGSIARWLKGATPSGTALEKVSNEFKVSTDWLLGLTNYRNTEEQLKEAGNKNATIAAHMEDLNLTEEQEKAVIEYIKSIKKIIK